uniref:tRNA N(3)-methylcytidine methyltransferase n=1 Tax=Magallana gigas TaxID=29159 RepID=K1QWQ1_MAGGI
MENKLNNEDEKCDEIKDSASNAKVDESEKALDTEMKKMTVTETITENSESGSGEDGDEKFVHPVRILTEAEIAKLQKDVTCVSDFKQNKLEKEAQKNWDLFYKRNTTKFFKDRHWTKREFDELCPVEAETGRRTVLEVGCGVGNFIWPLLQEDQSMFFYACDFSPRAVQFVKDNPNYDPSRCSAFQCDITNDDLSGNVPQDSVMRPGGSLLFRDYGLYDYAMLRFAPGHKLSENFYVRQDGTRAYYFTTEKVLELAERCGFDRSQSQCEYVQRETVNKKEDLCVPRIFVQGKFLKPKSS